MHLFRTMYIQFGNPKKIKNYKFVIKKMYLFVSVVS